ncbi:LOW QUALITY PROTEIN: hypothetical protein BC938DRAFT_475095 [Jimgerdemannia flammicorona]|uniref:Uncharacterized protein n=1 Tax=Jimgerdemannia flammicorona TaxID=994334 RepID=A0A433QRZ7_9FUNG|nr:LOW QUALITY PROTEIN: hypothetical protein BC938DRAFT_475095 [Jimgerdemannia flammicorona]
MFMVIGHNHTGVCIFPEFHWNAINNWISGLDHAGKHKKGWTTLNLFGGNFQSLSVVQKTNYYLKIRRHTVSRHGTCPPRVHQDPSTWSVPVIYFSGDDVGLLCLKSNNESVAAGASLYIRQRDKARSTQPRGRYRRFGNSATDHVYGHDHPNRPGAIYTKESKVSKHGGFNEDVMYVLFIVHNPRFHAKNVSVPVSTKQIAPSILVALELNQHELQAFAIGDTRTLHQLCNILSDARLIHSMQIPRQFT